MVVDGRQHLHIGPVLLDPRRTDEYSPNLAFDAFDVDVGLERGVLAAEGVASNRDVEHTELHLVAILGGP